MYSQNEILSAAKSMGCVIPDSIVLRFVARVILKLLQGKTLCQAITETAAEMLQ
ncbi:MAG: hypothetical protein HQM09_22360 [Candidatus Riflebacteria bacterium]|nr:hypothetical protein [Candidatus Riflebacteria bacterium]